MQSALRDLNLGVHTRRWGREEGVQLEIHRVCVCTNRASQEGGGADQTLVTDIDDVIVFNLPEVRIVVGTPVSRREGR